MTVTVEYSVVASFILDDEIAGVLDNTVYTLDGEKFESVTADLITASITRGKNRELDRFSAGNGSLEFRNDQRQFDPQYDAGALYNNLVPMRPIRVNVDGKRIFTGLVDDFNYSYTPKPESKAQLQVSDELTLLAREELSGLAVSEELSGSRVNTILDNSNVAWPSDERDISPGDKPLAAGTAEGNVLEYLRRVSGSEQGALFVAKNGDLVFLDSNDNAARSGSVTEFADDNTGIPFSRLLVNYGTEQLYNTVEITSTAGTATAQNARSRQIYGILSYNLETLLASQLFLDNLADFVVTKFADPEYRVQGLTINLDRLTTSQRADLLDLELGDMCKVTFTPNSLGDPIVQFAQLIGIGHDIEQTRHDVTLNFAATDFTVLVLDDTQFGTIGSNALGF